MYLLGPEEHSDICKKIDEKPEAWMPLVHVTKGYSDRKLRYIKYFCCHLQVQVYFSVQ